MDIYGAARNKIHVKDFMRINSYLEDKKPNRLIKPQNSLGLYRSRSAQIKN